MNSEPIIGDIFPFFAHFACDVHEVDHRRRHGQLPERPVSAKVATFPDAALYQSCNAVLDHYALLVLCFEGLRLSIGPGFLQQVLPGM